VLFGADALDELWPSPRIFLQGFRKVIVLSSAPALPVHRTFTKHSGSVPL